ncbi:hypothetical protein PpBr36_01477 [Pyricularia pennisetigena]|uniref:hypothetical protein n=1 Tax=Pyricularia pennisetigena TaxID=1578925 RepID=UPI001150CDB8|nr:hypothetical protein PpBr36_01477 [Pyricularia pennisetigena]TLS29268.1 hypothetical protein PpBr36_01477 [Pyricularia pennisetigena]
MRVNSIQLALAGLVAVSNAVPVKQNCNTQKPITKLQLGPRPYWLIDSLEDSPLKAELEQCKEMEMKPTAWSIGHRGGGTMQIPEHSRESFLAGTRMGAGIQECDVAFTKDLELVCRHSHCDLHTTTNIVDIPELNAKCTKPFQPADPATGKTATAKCCTSDITVAEFKTLCAKMDGSNPNATTPAQYLKGTPAWRTDLYSNECAKVLTHKESIKLIDSLGLKFTPELKTPEVPMPFAGDYTQERYAQQMIDEYKEAGIAPSRVYPQSFLYADILYWLKAEPEFAKQAVYLDESADAPGAFPGAVANLTRYAADGVPIIAPPLPYLVTMGKGADGKEKIVPSVYATEAKRLGMKIIAWTAERSGWVGNAARSGDYYYTTIANYTKKDGDAFQLLDVLGRDIGVLGVFSDWSATVTYYANCFGLFP